MCFTFNHNQMNNTPRYSDKRGRRSGLKMMLNIERDQYAGVFTSEVGAIMTVHDPQHAPYPEKFGASISPGESAYFRVIRKQVG